MHEEHAMIKSPTQWHFRFFKCWIVGECFIATSWLVKYAITLRLHGSQMCIQFEPQSSKLQLWSHEMENSV